MIKLYRRMGSARHFVPLALLMPIAKSVVGIDGGAVFQVIAAENLAMSSTTIGLAFGLGVLSLPVQLLAARFPLARAKPNLRLFAVLLGVLAAVMAVLVRVGPSSSVTVAAITVAVTAEVALSVLYATSWLPLQNSILASTERQWLSSRVRAVGGLASIALLLAVAAGDGVVRTALIVAVAAMAIVVTVDLRAIPGPRPPAAVPPLQTSHDRRPTRRFDRRTIWLLVCSGVLGFASWPVFLVYTSEVLWPAANIGAVGALQLVGSFLTALAWRPARDDLGGRARTSGAVLVASTIALCVVRSPVDGNAAAALVLAATVVSAAALSALQLTLLELVHRTVRQTTAVRVFTVLDVVASTSLQVGLLAGGVLTALSSSGARVDLYRASLVLSTVLALALVVATTRRRSPAVGAGAAG